MVLDQIVGIYLEEDDFVYNIINHFVSFTFSLFYYAAISKLSDNSIYVESSLKILRITITGTKWVKIPSNINRIIALDSSG